MTANQRDFSKTRESLYLFMNALLDDLEQCCVAPDPVTVPVPKEDDSAETMTSEDASAYLGTTSRNLALLRKYNLVKFAKCGKRFMYRKDWLNQFLDEWVGYDLSSEGNIKLAINGKKWKEKHG